MERGHTNTPGYKTRGTACCLNPWVRPASPGKHGLIELSPLSTLMGTGKPHVPATGMNIPAMRYKEPPRSAASVTGL